MNTRIYTADTELFRDAELYSRIYACLPESRREKVSRYRREEDQLRSLAAGALLLRLCRDEGLPESMPDLRENEYGKPFFSEHPDVQFSLSHSGTKVLLAVSDRPVGCDVEKISEKPDPLSIARHFFAPGETWLLTEAEPDALVPLFYRLWTLKESFVKETGRGLYLPLQSFRIILSEDAPIGVRLLEDQDPAVSDDVFFLQDSPGDGYAYAFCIAGDGADLPEMTIQKLSVPYLSDL